MAAVYGTPCAIPPRKESKQYWKVSESVRNYRFTNQVCKSLSTFLKKKFYKIYFKKLYMLLH
jgi:hypothetical protein